MEARKAPSVWKKTRSFGVNCKGAIENDDADVAYSLSNPPLHNRLSSQWSCGSSVTASGTILRARAICA